MTAKEIIKILIQADIIEQESDIETTYTQKREWIAKEILAREDYSPLSRKPRKSKNKAERKELRGWVK